MKDRKFGNHEKFRDYNEVLNANRVMRVAAVFLWGTVFYGIFLLLLGVIPGLVDNVAILAGEPDGVMTQGFLGSLVVMLFIALSGSTIIVLLVRATLWGYHGKAKALDVSLTKTVNKGGLSTEETRSLNAALSQVKMHLLMLEDPTFLAISVLGARFVCFIANGPSPEDKSLQNV